MKLLQANDNSDIHGGLAGLTELTMAYEEILSGEMLESKKREVSSQLFFRYSVLSPEDLEISLSHTRLYSAGPSQ